MYCQKKNKFITLSKRPKSGDKGKYATLINSKVKTNFLKYSSCLQSPKKIEDILFIKKKLNKVKKDSKNKLNIKSTNNTNNNNNSNISSSNISLMSPLNKNYLNSKQNYGLHKFLKKKLILNSVNNSFLKEKENEINKMVKINASKGNIANKKYLNYLTMNKSTNSNYVSNKKFTQTTETSNNNQKRMEINDNNINQNLNDTKDNHNQKSKKNNKNKKKEIKEYQIKDYKNCQKPVKFNATKLMNNKSKNFGNKIYSMKGSFNISKNIKNKNNISNTNHHLLSNTVFEYNKSQKKNNQSNFNIFDNYIKSIKMNIINKSVYNKSGNINFSYNINKKNNSTFCQNNISNSITKRDSNILGNNYLNLIQSPRANNMSKTTKNSPNPSLTNLNYTFNRIKKFIKSTHLSIITKSDTHLLLNKIKSCNDSQINNKKKINYKHNINLNYSTNNNNIFQNNDNLQGKVNNHKKGYNLLNMINSKKIINSPYDLYLKKKIHQITNDNTYNNINSKMKLVKKITKPNRTENNSKTKNQVVKETHKKNSNLSNNLERSAKLYQKACTSVDSNMNSAKGISHVKQKTKDIIVNNYNININNQINNTNTFFSDKLLKNKHKMNISSKTNLGSKKSLRDKKIFSKSFKELLIPKNKNINHLIKNKSPINKLEMLLNTNHNFIKSEDKFDNINKFTYKKWSSNRERIDKKKKIKKSEMMKRLDNKHYIDNIDKNSIIYNSQRKYLDLKKNEKFEKSKILSGGLKTKTKKSNLKIQTKIDNLSHSLIKFEPTISSRSSISYDSNYYMKESLKLSNFITKYYEKYKDYPNTSLKFYKYGRLIGQGAFGKVLLGLNILTGRIVAVKSFNKNNSQLTGKNMQKIKYETDLMKKLNHPNITKVLEMFEDEKFFMIIMEYINGGNLFTFVKKRRKLSEKTAKFLFKQIILGIKYIHEQNIVHRDIKLENLLIDLNNNVKICDFGIGRKITNKKELLYDKCGTLMYMAPEILLSTDDKGYEGFPVDIWSSGISLYIMLSGSLPFNVKTRRKNSEGEEIEEDSISDSDKNNEDSENYELQYSIVYREPKYIENISDEARDLLQGLLNKDPKKRLTCDEILNHPWLKNISKKYTLFTKAELIMLSKTFIDYRKGNADDLKENFSLSNLEDKIDKKNPDKENMTTKSSILAPYNSVISDSDSNSKNLNSGDSLNDFNNSKIHLEQEQIIFSKKIKEYNRLYELNNNGELDNGILINSKTQSSNNITDRSKYNDILHLTISNESEEDPDNKIKDKIENMKNNKIENILNDMKNMGFDEKYILDCVNKNILCHASAVYYLMMNYENI